MTDIAIYQASVPDRMRYAEALSGSSLLPRDYVGKPANVLLAIEYGAALGIPPMTAIQGVHVINGKPTASAGLIGALVRKAGHRLRVTGDDRHAVCEIVRADDPDFTFRAEWTWDRAVSAKLTGKDTWKAYPAAMLKARAITECARDACPEALAGVAYTAEELGSDEPADAYPQTSAAPSYIYDGDAAGAADDLTGPDVVEAEIVTEDDGAAGGGEAPVAPSLGADRPHLNNPDGPPTQNQLGMLGVLLKGVSRTDALREVSGIVGREVESRNDLSKREMSLVIDELKSRQP